MRVAFRKKSVRNWFELVIKIEKKKLIFTRTSFKLVSVPLQKFTAAHCEEGAIEVACETERYLVDSDAR